MHLRVMSDLNVAAPAPECLWTEAPGLTALHDLAFASVKVLAPNLRQSGRSLIALFTGAIADVTLHPLAGLFSGLIASFATELRECLAYALFTDTTDAARAVAQAAEESRLQAITPMVVRKGDERLTYVFSETAAPVSPETTVRLDAESVVIATGGARGIVAEAVKALAALCKPRLFVIGSNPLDLYGPELLAGDDDSFLQTRQAFIRQRKANAPELSVKDIVAEFDRILSARLAVRNIEEMRRLCGPDRVRYIACDVLDRDGLVQRGTRDRRGNRPDRSGDQRRGARQESVAGDEDLGRFSPHS